MRMKYLNGFYQTFKLVSYSFSAMFFLESSAVLSKFQREVFVVPEDTPKDSWTFGICTDGITNVKFHQKIIDSIRNLNIPHYEIIFATENENYVLDGPDLKVLLVKTNKPMHITLKKNRIAEISRYPNLCLMHDYMYPELGWYEGFQKFGYNWDICSSIFLNPDGSHGDEWIHYRGPFSCKRLPYHWRPNENSFVPGMYFCVKKSFIIEHPLDENLIWGQNEDLVWSASIHRFWNYVFNQNSTIRSLKQKASPQPI
jgi:hypothetical protein